MLIKNDPAFNAAWPRAVVPYRAVHGVDEPTRLPWLPNDGTRHPELPRGTPHALTPLLTKDGGGQTVVQNFAAGARNGEFLRDIRPVLTRSCVPCRDTATAAGHLVLDQTANVPGTNGRPPLPGDYARLAADQNAQWGHPPIIGNRTWRQTNASRYIRAFQSRRSLLTWKIFGRRMDGWTNADHPTESAPGNPATLPLGADRNAADLDCTGTIMPPPGSAVPPLSEDEKMMFARWIDLGCPINTGQLTSPRPTQRPRGATSGGKGAKSFPPPLSPPDRRGEEMPTGFSAAGFIYRLLSHTMSFRPPHALCLFTALAATAFAAEPPVPAKIEYNRDVRPILSDTCFHCHGPDAKAREAKLRLDIREEALKPAESGETPIVPGKPEKSEVVRRLFTSDKDELMPPPKAHKELTGRQKEILKQWIAQGAVYQKHWAYEAPVKAVIPAGKKGVDFLVEKRLAELGLKPSLEADRRTLIRRVSFDLTGLPPTPQELEAFAKDTAPDAYEKVVDRLMANPHYGERMALGWLDVVRFADTIGYHSDNPHNVWPYRDWVIRAFNENKPFDRFTIEQVAGDLLPDATAQTRIGSAFNLLILSTEEGGAQAKDYEARAVTDRVRAIGSAWMGQTTGCAQCHDHKFDPITARDFYSLGAFFADLQEKSIGKRDQGMAAPSPEHEQQVAKLDGEIAEAKKKVAALDGQFDAEQKTWEAGLMAKRDEEIAKRKAAEAAEKEQKPAGEGEAAKESAKAKELPQPAIVLPELESGSRASAGDKKTAKQVADILGKEPKDRGGNEPVVVRDYFRAKVAKIGQAERTAVASLEGQRKKLDDNLPRVMVSMSGKPRTVRILARGNFLDESGEVVKAALPHYLPQPKIEGREATRLDLAQWLVARDNPLTARTVMNRLWKQFFGTGLSKVLDDLGAQGETPANPALLDWLACEFMDGGWDFKRMVRGIVSSHAYRQVSTVTPELLAADPFNREHARQSRFRVDAELVRDNALAISGLLVPKIGGPSVRPYQPDRYWENLNFPVRTYQADPGESQYRRGIYTWWQRSFVHPSMLAFDAPTREECAAERNRSNIPQQALVLLNDPSYVEAARAFAARILSECKGTSEQRIAWAWQRALQRPPSSEEAKAMSALFAERLAAYRADVPAAEALLKSGLAPVPADLDKAELAAWTHVARVLLNLHETITRS